MSVDPGLLRGQQASTLGRGQFHNVYAYSANNPYRFVDPSGNTPIDLVFLAVDVAKLGFAVYTGVGISSAVVDVGLSIAGVVSPVAGTGELLKAGRGAEHSIEAITGIQNGADAVRSSITITKETIEKKTLGADGARKIETIERENGAAISRTQTVTKDGEIIHQHQNQIGKHGGERQFPDEWTGTKTVGEGKQKPPYENHPPQFGPDKVPGGRY
ncbi:hypothetical protein [Nitrospira lenta]|uniref:hypothetical protein n=1 Tax=Nitrospira lenta TaxID=1436998 RepID=UPI0011B433AF|nr:hypothetical protein [Nitrospira lenta]